MHENLTAWDVAIIVVYLAGITAIGTLSGRVRKLTSNAYFLAGRSLSWPVVGAALFASNISSIHLVGLAASGYNEGLVWGNFEWMAVPTLIILGLVFAPFYFRNRITTLPEFLERRYSPIARSFLAAMAIFAALFIHIGMSLYAGAAVFEQFFGVDVIASILVISLLTGIYTIVGGFKAVVITETIQTFVLLAGAVVVTFFGIWALPEHGIDSFAAFRAALKPGQFSMLHPDNSNGPAWYAVLLGYPVLGIWYWCTDQTIVQRVLGARSERDAQLGPLFAGLLKIFPVFIMVFPGLIGYVLFRDVIGNEANHTLPILITHLVPPGLRGLIIAGLLAALMSTIAAALNSSATLVALDIVKRFRPEATDAIQIAIGRISAVIVMLLAMVWSTFGNRYSSIFEAINVIAADLAPPITTVFVWGVFWRRGTHQAAVTTLAVGFLLGVAGFAADLPLIGTEKLISHRWGISFLMQAWWVFCFCSILFVLVSLATDPPKKEQIEGLTWERPFAVLRRSEPDGGIEPKWIAGTLLLFLLCLYYVFA